MAAPGYSLIELYQVAKQAKQIWNAFTDEFESAPARIRELVETCDYFSQALFDFTSLLDQYEETYPKERSFDRKLCECQAFIDKYWSLKADYLTKLQTHKWMQVWYTALPLFLQSNTSAKNHDRQTARYAYEDGRAQELRDGLSLEIQKLLAFIVVFALLVSSTRSESECSVFSAHHSVGRGTPQSITPPIYTMHGIGQ